MTVINSDSSAFVAAYASGENGEKLPVWAGNPSTLPRLQLLSGHVVQRRDLKLVPAAFQLFNVLTVDECERLIRLSTELGYHQDAAIALPREIRHNENVVWLADELTIELLWSRIEGAINQDVLAYGGKRAVGINPRWRFYRYQRGDFFKLHKDGSCSSSRLVGAEMQQDLSGGMSQMSLLLLLNDDFEGGATRFLVNADDPAVPPRYYNRTKEIEVRTPRGAALCFPHGEHPLQCSHSGDVILDGCKYIIRTDVFFQA